MRKYALLTLSFLVWTLVGQAQVIAPSAQEVQFSYTTKFYANAHTGKQPQDIAHFHARHMFGLFASPTLIQKFSLDPFLVGGIGAPQVQMNIRIHSAKQITGKKLEIEYSNTGKLLLEKHVAARVLKAQSFVVPLPSDPFEIYDVKCTDKDFPEPVDYWYHYDAFRTGCERLSEPPLANPVVMKISPSSRRKVEQSPRLDLLRANNGNGPLFSIYVIQGYAETSGARDDGRVNFNRFNQYLRKKGFEETRSHWDTTRPMTVFRKDIKIPSGHVINAEIKHLLVETDIISRNVTFAKFFKQAVAEADVIVYAGHSGLGDNLNIPALEAKAGKFKFNPNKRQIFYLDSCSSYSYYLQTFSAEKTKARIDVMTNGLASYFDGSDLVLNSFIEVLLSEKHSDMSWLNIMSLMEKPLDGGTYLLNVGGI